MKSTRFLPIIAGLVAIAVSAVAQTLDTTNSRWGATLSNSFTSGGGFYATGVSTPAYGLVINTPSVSTVFGLADPQIAIDFPLAPTPPVPVADYNLSSTVLTASTPLKLVITGLSGVPNYVAYTGGPLTAYSYSSGTLTIETTTVNPVLSGSDPSNQLLSAFGMIIVTSPTLPNFGGTVFRSDMWWGDINPLNTSYTNTNPTVGLNVTGVNGELATFQAYMPVDFLTGAGIGMTQPADLVALVNRSGTVSSLGITRVFGTVTGAAPSFAGAGTDYTAGGASPFDFNGGGFDDYAVLTYANSNWSAGNIGISAIPEPGDFALGAGAAALALVYLRRRRRAAA